MKDLTHVLPTHRLEQHKNNIIAALCFLGIAAVTLSIVFTIDIYASVQLIHAQPASLNPIFMLQALSLLAMYSSVWLFTISDRTYISKVIRKNMIHSFLYVIAVLLIISLSGYAQYSFIQQTLDLVPTTNSVTNPLRSIALIRSLLFALGSPLIAYATCTLAANLRKHSSTLTSPSTL